MGRGPRVLREVVVTALTFSLSALLLASAVAGILLAMNRGAFEPDLILGSALWAFLMGLAVSGFLALTAPGRPFREISLPHFAGLGIIAGVFFFGIAASMAGDFWDRHDALLNLLIFSGIGGGSATATLLVQRAGPARP